MEALRELTQELIETIAAIEDYVVLIAIKESLDFHNQYPLEGPYDFPGATEEEREELIRMDKEEELDLSDCASQEEYDKLMSRWLTKQSTRTVI